MRLVRPMKLMRPIRSITPLTDDIIPPPAAMQPAVFDPFRDNQDVTDDEQQAGWRDTGNGNHYCVSMQQRVLEECRVLGSVGYWGVEGTGVWRVL